MPPLLDLKIYHGRSFSPETTQALTSGQRSAQGHQRGNALDSPLASGSSSRASYLGAPARVGSVPPSLVQKRSDIASLAFREGFMNSCDDPEIVAVKKKFHHEQFKNYFASPTGPGEQERASREKALRNVGFSLNHGGDANLNLGGLTPTSRAILASRPGLYEYVKTHSNFDPGIVNKNKTLPIDQAIFGNPMRVDIQHTLNFCKWESNQKTFKFQTFEELLPRSPITLDQLEWAAACGQSRMLGLLIQRYKEIYGEYSLESTEENKLKKLADAQNQLIYRFDPKNWVQTLFLRNKKASPTQKELNLMASLRCLANSLQDEGICASLEFQFSKAMSLKDLESLKIFARSGIIDLNTGHVYNSGKKNAILGSPLKRSIDDDHLEVAKFLVEYGADVDGNPFDEYVPLLHAIQEGHFDFVDFLKTQGANLNKAGKINGKTVLPLLLLIEKGCADLVKSFIESGAEVDRLISKVDPRKGFNSYDVFERLVDQGQCMSLLQFAISCSSPILMYPSIDVDASIKIVKLLLDAGANPFGQSIAGIDGDPPQRINSAREHLEKLKYPNFIKERLISLLEEAKLRWTPQRGLAG